MKQKKLFYVTGTTVIAVAILLVIYFILIGTGAIHSRQDVLVFRADSADKVYDGKALSDNGWKLTEGKLATGHRAVVTVTGSQELPGSSENRISVMIVDGLDRDVTEEYNVSCFSGTLTVQPRPITVTTRSASKVYDGSALTATSWDLEDGSLLKGHGLNVRVLGTITDAGSIPNECMVEVTDHSGNDVSHLYGITKEYGTLTITKRILTISSASASKVYDGSALTAPEWGIVNGSLASKDLLYVDVIGTISNVGYASNVFEIKLLNIAGSDNSQNYSINFDFGRLEIFKDAIPENKGEDINGDGIPDYDLDGDGIPDVDINGDGVPDVDINGDGVPDVDINGDGIPDVDINGDGVPDVDINGDGIPDVDLDGDGDIDVDLDGDGVPDDSQGNLEGGTNDGTQGSPGSTDITMPPEEALENQKNTVYAKVKTTVSGRVYLRYQSCGDYDGKGWTVGNPYHPNGSVNPLYLSSLALKNAGYESNHMEIESLVLNSIFPYYMETGYGDSLSDIRTDLGGGSYTVSYIPFDYFWADADYTVSDEFLALEHEYRMYVYENYLDVPQSTKDALVRLAAENGIEAGSKTLIEDIARYIQNAATYNLNAVYPDNVDDVVVYFLTEAKEGICQHYASAATLMYRSMGIPARYVTGLADTVTANEWREITGEKAHAWVEVYLDGFGWVPVEVTGGSSSAGGTGGGIGGGNDDGVRKLVLKPAEETRAYDGTPLTVQTYVDVYNVLRSNHHVEFTAEGEQIFVGSCQSALTSVRILDEKGNDVSDQYEVILQTGTLTVTQRPLQITANSAYKIYDGIPLSADGYFFDGATSLASTDSIACKVSGIQEKYGLSYNEITEWRITNKEGLDVSDQYEVKLAAGELRVVISELRIHTDSFTMEYDGTALSAPKYFLESGTLWDGHFLTVEMNASRIDVGETRNIPTVQVLDAQGNDVTEWYLFSSDLYGTIKVTPAVLEVETGSAEKEFDGYALVCHEYKVVVGTLKNGDVLSVTFAGEQINVGQSENEASSVVITSVRNGVEVDVTSNYIIHFVYGVLKVTPPTSAVG